MGIVKTLRRKYNILKNSLISEKKLNLSGKNILITGCNSGIGLNIFKKIVNENNVLAFVNDNSEEVDKFKNANTSILKCDFSDIDNIKNYYENILKFCPNIVINCAATFGDSSNLENFDIKKYYKVLNINVLTPISIIKKSIEAKNLEQVVNISSEMGSINLNKSGNFYFYRTSKSLLNSFSKNLAIEFKNKINIFCIHPGSVKTKMNTGGDISPEFSAQKIINICSNNEQSLSGFLIDINKNILSW
tara:strand:+ start:1849 stop:2589 length:741 start_codon:yes stop_codon:yes gene_type:complete